MNKKKANSKNKINKKSEVTAYMNYPIGDFLIRLKNAVMAKKRHIKVRRSNLVENTAKVLLNEGYLGEVKKENDELEITLAFRKKEPVILDIKLVSSPGLRVYQKAADFENEKGPSIFIVSTPQGVMTSREAIKKRLGGEVICQIW